MPVKLSTIFVLWGYRCDEVAAVIFVTGLRRLGLRVQMAGITAQYLEGAYGVKIQPDVMLKDALSQARRALCVILPFDDAALRRFADEDRLRSFLQIAWKNGAWFVTQDETEELLKSMVSTTPQANWNDRFITYATSDELIASVNHLALQLLSMVNKEQ